MYDAGMLWRISEDVCRNRGGQPGGAEWVASLTNAIPAMLDRWGLVDVRQDLPSDWNIVLRGVHASTGQRVVAKFCLPDTEFAATTAALEVPAEGLVRLLDTEPAHGAHLLAWVDGSPMQASEGDQSGGMRVGRAVARLSTLPWRAGMIPLRRWCRELLEPPFRHPDWDELVDINRLRCEQLLSGPVTEGWVHGDLHHGNLIVLPDGSDVVIDPKGVFGDPAFDACTFVRNQIDIDLPETVLRSRFEERISAFSEGSGLPLDRCAAWAAAGNVLSEIWDAEGVAGEGFGRQLRYVRILSDIAASAGMVPLR